MSTKIPWTNETWNFQGGCTPVSPGCLNCAAARSAEDCTKHWGNKKYEGLTANGKWTGELRFFPEELEKPLHWKKPRMVFPAFMSDLFHESVPFKWLAKVLAVMLLSPQHQFQILTKRPERMKEFFQWIIDESNRQRFINEEAFIMDLAKINASQKKLKEANQFWESNYSQKDRGMLDSPVPYPYPNLWLGVTAENQEQADKRIPILLQVPAAKRWISIELCSEEIVLPKMEEWQNCITCDGGCEKHPICATGTRLNHLINWIIVGCESGPKRRPCKPEWIKSIINQCKASDVSVFVKQIEINGKVEHNINKFPKELQYQEFPK